jgi:hypothetical protein
MVDGNRQTPIVCLCGTSTQQTPQEATASGWFILWRVSPVSVCPTCWHSAEPDSMKVEK